jgi:hypothetical protein
MAVAAIRSWLCLKMKRGFCKKWIKQTRLVVALIVFWAVFFQSVPAASAAMSQQTLRCDTGTSIGVDTTNFTCTTASTPYDIGLLLDKTTGTSTTIRIGTAGNGPWAYAYFINNTAFPVPVRVTAYSASIPLRISTSGRTNKGWYELGYYNPNGIAGNMPANFVGLFNSTIATTTSATQSSFAISFNGQSAVIPAGYKLAVRVWMNVSGSSDRPYYYSFSTAANSNSSFFVDITPLTAGATYNISGYVTNKTSGLPLSGAAVRTNTSLTTTTNAAGFYNFTGLSNGTYVINASLTGYAVNSINVAINGAHNTTANISLTTVPTYQLSGYVTNASNGQAITGATVTTDTGLFTSTDGTGYYSFTVSDGTYIITASKPGYSGNSTTQTINGAAVGNANIMLTLVPLSIGGKILVATNRFVVLDDPTTGTPDTGSGFTNPGSSWGTTNWIGKNTIINATALYMYDNGTPVSGKVINFTLYRYGGTQVNTIARTTDINGLANYSYDLNLNNYYGNWRVSASSGDIGANTTFIYNWWGCTISVTGCSGHSSKSLTTGATINSPYLSGRDRTTSATSQHTAAGTNCTYCHQSFDGKPGGQTSITNHTNYPSDVHRNIACDNVNCHNTKTVHSTNAVIGSCYNSACHTPANRSDISNKSTLNSAALSLYSYANGSIFNASFHTPNSTVPCIICHGPMHNITKPDESLRFIRNNNTEDSQCKTCHSSYNEHNSSNTTSGGVNCTLCHSDDVHDIQVFSQNATYVDLNHNNPNPARGDCTNCHQNATFFDALKAQPKAGKYTGRDPPQIQVPLNHSTDPYAGALWNGSQSAYWDNTNKMSACYYCHGLTTLHAISALGSIGSVKGTNNLNQDLANSTWCANCHYKNAPGFGGNQFSLPPPEILNQGGLVPAISGDGTSFYNHSGAISTSYNDATCKNCHDNNLNAGATSLNFSHNVGRGQAGGANCTGCHNIGGSAGAGKLVNISAMNDANAIHSGLNSGAITSLPAENKKCWACHGNGSEPGSGHPSTYKNPYRCPDCHVPDAGQNLKFTPNNTLLSVTQHYGNGTSISTSAAASCYDCHNKTEMMLGANLDPDGAGSVYGGANGGSGSASHYGKKRTDYPAQGTNDYCNKCHNNLTTVFPFIDNANKTIANHSSGYPSSNPDCADCHETQAGRIHNSTLYKPASPMNNNSFCLGCHGNNGTGGTNYTGAVTGFKENHNNAVNCTGCHLNDSRSIHPVKYLQQDGSSFNTSKTNTANCATCHQGGNFSTAPKIPAPMNHSTNPYNGSLWNGTQQGYWTNSDTQSACVYCHGITLHNASALGNITKIMGTNTINQSLTGSYWCANCHYKNAPDYSGNLLNPVPPEVLNMNGLVPVTSSDGTAFYNHSDALSSGYDDSRCKNCHGRELKPGATSLDFSHNLKPSEGGPDCVSCHDVSGNGGPENRKINSSAMRLGVHTNLNSNAGNTSILDPINKACWACHGNGTQPEKHPVNYQNPKPCEYCHVNNNFNATLVYRHYPGSVFSGTVVYDSLNSNRTCVSCHNNSLVANQNINYGGYAPEKLKNASVSHYVVSRTLGESMPSAVTGILPDTRAATGTNFGCNKCHNAGAVGTDYGNARILPSSHNIMGSTGISCQTSCHNSNPQVNMTLHDIKIGMYVGSNGCFSAGCHVQPGTGGRRKR